MIVLRVKISFVTEGAHCEDNTRQNVGGNFPENMHSHLDLFAQASDFELGHFIFETQIDGDGECVGRHNICYLPYFTKDDFVAKR